MPPVLQSYRTLQRPSINLKLDNRSHFVMPLPMLFRTENVKFELTGRSRYKHHVSFCFVAHVRRLLRATPPRPPLRPRWPLSSPLCEKPRPLPLLSAELLTGISFSGIKKRGKIKLKDLFQPSNQGRNLLKVFLPRENLYSPAMRFYIFCYNWQVCR